MIVCTRTRIYVPHRACIVLPERVPNERLGHRGKGVAQEGVKEPQLEHNTVHVGQGKGKGGGIYGSGVGGVEEPLGTTLAARRTTKSDVVDLEEEFNSKFALQFQMLQSNNWH